MSATSSTALPGYGGYHRLYQREHVPIKINEVPAHKYDGVANTSRGLMKGSSYQTEYGGRTGPETVVTSSSMPLTASGSYPPLVAAVPVTLADGTSVAGFAGGAPVSTGAVVARSAQSSSGTIRSALRSAGHGSVYGSAAEGSSINADHLAFVAARVDQEQREAYQVQPESVSHWKTTYGAAHDAHRSYGTHREVSARTDAATLSMSQRMRGDQNAVLAAPSSLLRATRAQSGYAMDFGRNGSNPLDRHIPSDGKTSISKNATTRDLFLGSTKATSRLPGYSGHVPAEPRNLSQLAGDAVPNVKDHLVFNYRENVPGYTGHRPRAAVNDRLIRSHRPSGARPVLQGSLILDSMKVT